MSDSELAPSNYTNVREGLDDAQLSIDAGKIDEALMIFARVRATFPTDTTAVIRAASVLMQRRDFDRAEDVLADAPTQYPTDLTIAITRAWIAHHRSEMDEAIRRWQLVQTMSPNTGHGYCGITTTLIHARRFEEAEAACRVTTARFPSDATGFIEQARLSAVREDWHRALEQSQRIIERFGHIAGYLGAYRAMLALSRVDDADRLLAEGMQRFPDSVALAKDYVHVAERRQDWVAAAERWATFCRLDPNNAEACIRRIHVLMTLRRFDDIEALAPEIAERFPQSAELASQFAWLAIRRHQWDAAALAFANIRQRFPRSQGGYLGGAQVLREQRRLEDAEQLLLEGTRAAPDNAGIYLEYARIPLASHQRQHQDWPEALRRMEELRRRFPEFPLGFQVGIDLLKNSNQLEAAEALATEAIGRFPDHVALWTEHARLALARKDHQEALQRYAVVRDRFPNEPGGYRGEAAVLCAMGRLDEADAILCEAATRFPGDYGLASEYGGLPVYRHDWREMLVRWEEVGRRFPHVEQAQHRIFEARMRMLEDTMAAPEPKPDDKSIDDATNLMMQFESLGGAGHGCEFGIVQRRFGAEPLGLLRWADLNHALLTAALSNSFEGVGEIENTEVFVSRDGEYWTRDKRYWMAMRCFIRADEIAIEKMTTRACRRLVFLRRKLLEDLKTDTKIFVFKNMVRTLTGTELDHLHWAVRRYSNNTLLYVRWEDEAHPNGTVEWRAPGLMVGYIDHFSFSPTDEILPDATPSWMAVCLNAYALWQESKQAVRNATAGSPPARLRQQDDPGSAEASEQRQMYDIPHRI